MTRIVTGPVVVLLLLLSGCGASKEEAKKQLDELLGHMNTMGDTLASIKDEASAKAGMEKIQETASKVKNWKVNEPKVTKSVANELTKEYEKPLMDAEGKIMMQAARVQGIPGGKEAGDEALRVLQSLAAK